MLYTLIPSCVRYVKYIVVLPGVAVVVAVAATAGVTVGVTAGVTVGVTVVAAVSAAGAVAMAVGYRVRRVQRPYHDTMDWVAPTLNYVYIYTYIHYHIREH